MTAMAALTLLASDSTARLEPPAVAPPMPPAVMVTSRQQLLSWHPGEVRCDGTATPEAGTVRRPLNMLTFTDRPVPPAQFEFAIDADGRALSIRRQNGSQASWDQIAPALAASRFAPGKARRRCVLSYTARIEPVRDAPLAEVASYAASMRSRSLLREVSQRLREGDGCMATVGMQALVRVYPDLATIPATPGVADWTLVGFDVSAGGRATSMVTRTGTGNAALDKAAIDAIAASRFNAGALRKGCTLPFYRPAGRLTAPPMPDTPEPTSGPCASSGDWAEKPRLVYPQAYQRRLIEGWAIVEYDVAPWGATGNTRVVEAQPSEDFGVAAKAMLERARRPAGPGATGCRAVVRYVMADEKAPIEQDAESDAP